MSHNNRLLMYCPCCSAKRRVRDRLLSLRETVRQIEADALGVIEAIVPSLKSYNEGRRRVQFYLLTTPTSAAVSDNLRAHVAGELRRIGNQLCEAATAVETEGGVA